MLIKVLVIWLCDADLNIIPKIILSATHCADAEAQITFPESGSISYAVWMLKKLSIRWRDASTSPTEIFFIPSTGAS